MKITNLSKILCGALTLSLLSISCSKKTVSDAEDPTVDSSKQVTGTIEVTTPRESSSSDLTFSGDAKDLFNSIGNSLSDITGSAIDSFNSAIDSLKDSETLNAINDKISSAVETLQNPDTYTDALESAKEKITSSAESLKDSEAVNAITDKINEASESISNIGIDKETQDALESLKALGGKLGF